MAAIDKVGVVGAGLMGSEIALVFALAGKDVLLNDVSDEHLGRAVENLGRILDKGAQRGFYTAEQKAGTLGRTRRSWTWRASWNWAIRWARSS